MLLFVALPLVVAFSVVVGVAVNHAQAKRKKQAAARELDRQVLKERAESQSKQLEEKDAQLLTMAHEKAELEAKYLAKLKAAEAKKAKIAAWKKKKVDTHKGLSEQAAEIVAEQDKWLPHARAEKPHAGTRGKPKGSAGGGRARPEKVHHEKHVWPAHCPGCGADLEGAREKQPYTSVHTDIENLQDDPRDNKILALRNVLIYHHGRWCSHCKKWVYNDLGALKWARYGLNFVIFVISKRIATRMPFEMIISDLVVEFGLPLTLTAPAIVGWFEQYGDVLEEVCTQLKQIAALQDFTHVDETGLPLKGENWWVWVVCNAHFALYFESRTRGYAAVKDLAEELEGPVVSDCWTAYEKMEQEQQKCLGHLAASANEVLVAKQKENARIAKAQAKVEKVAAATAALPGDAPPRKKRGRPPAKPLPPEELAKLAAVAAENRTTIEQVGRLKALLGGAWKAGNPLYFGAPPGERATQDEAEQQLADLVAELRAEDPPDADFARILGRCEKYRGQWFTYLSHEGMPPDNNQAERDLRGWAAQRKVSGGFQNEQVVRAYLTYKSLFATCQKNDKDFQALLARLLSRQKVDLLDYFFEP